MSAMSSNGAHATGTVGWRADVEGEWLGRASCAAINPDFAGVNERGELDMRAHHTAAQDQDGSSFPSECRPRPCTMHTHRYPR